jgi:hydrogenase maturation protein HypF
VRVEGVVQGVGFRPYVFRLAGELGLAGFVRNDTRGVHVEVEGDPGTVACFLKRLPCEAPPLARIGRTAVAELAACGTAGFAILGSDAAGAPDAQVCADSAPCADCLRELRDPGDRRFGYPFINCTNCGPRFTIVAGVPYDRPLTTMAGFAMCADCRAEYDDPADRRFHAQPNACPACGPRLTFVGGEPGEHPDRVAAAAAVLRRGGIVAVKGLGGYHLACRADEQGVVARLRARKHREDKPFALMGPDVGALRAIVALDSEAEALLATPARPIVLAPRRAGARVARAVAPASRELGVMLPYTPLHHLLLDAMRTPLVMTSGNVSDEPIAYDDADALRRLGPIADAFLLHDRPIYMRTDDSVVRMAAGRPRTLRRSRGYVPAALTLPVPAGRPLLACGAHLKSAFCVVKGDRAWVGHHIGDLDDAATRRSFAEGVAHFERLFDVRPEVVVHDLHPDYASTAYALEREGVRTVAVQHHHAHLAACLAEHGVTEPAVGAIYDGSGLGTDGTTWGGEILVGDVRGAVRAGHLWPVRLPGGDHAARQPWRMAASWLGAAGIAAPAPPDPLRGSVDAERWSTVCEMVRRGFQAPYTTSAGRLFDAVAALCGLRASCTYEGQAAIELEALADPDHEGAYEIPVTDGLVLDPRPAIRAALGDVEDGVDASLVSTRMHRAMAEATAAALAAAAEGAGVRRAVLSGGVFQNRLLLEWTTAACRRRGLEVLVPEALPVNDGGIAFGQAAVAAAGGA